MGRAFRLSPTRVVVLQKTKTNRVNLPFIGLQSRRGWCLSLATRGNCPTSVCGLSGWASPQQYSPIKSNRRARAFQLYAWKMTTVWLIMTNNNELTSWQICAREILSATLINSAMHEHNNINTTYFRYFGFTEDDVNFEQMFRGQSRSLWELLRVWPRRLPLVATYNTHMNFFTVMGLFQDSPFRFKRENGCSAENFTFPLSVN